MTQQRGGAQLIPRPANARPGRAAPWAILPEDQRRLRADQMARALAERGPGRETPLLIDVNRISAVLVPLYEEGDELHVVLTKRAAHLRSHKGEVSFPGGRIDPGETALEAAYREAFEEIAMDTSGVKIIGELDRLATVSSRSRIVPYVGLLPNRPEGLVANPHEVASILHVPLSELTLDGVFREELWGPREGDRAVYFFELVGETVWGATARMLLQLLSVGLGLNELSDQD